MARTNVLSVFLAIVALVQQCYGQIYFTGHADTDFNIASTDPRYRTLQISENTEPVAVTDWMAEHNLTTGWDLKALAVQYDYLTDTLYVGFDCWVICGDADGDGNPDTSSDHGNKDDDGNYGPVQPQYDSPIQGGSEYTTLTLWTNPPASYVPSPSWENYLPDVIIGDSSSGTQFGTLRYFNSFVFEYQTYCSTHTASQCSNYIKTKANSPADGLNTTNPISKLSSNGQYPRSGIQNVTLYGFPNATQPDIEFTVPQFSRYGSFNFTPGIDDIIFAFGLVLGSGSDACGEERQYPRIMKIPCLIHDECGVCGGDNTTCQDCFNIPNGPYRYDDCGICGGDNTSCQDCMNIPNGPNVYDECGVCAGDNSSCFDCHHVPHGPARYDACGVCGGNNKSCWDCKHIPNGPHVYDACGVCGGDNTTCQDCFDIPHGPNRYDACGVCAGDNSTCQDCFDIPNGPNRYDACGVCAGDNSTCFDCKHIPNGPNRYDVCGICAGDGLSCLDCNGTVNGGKTFDLCHVCGGDNTSCADCLGIPNGPNHLDENGVCACFYEDTWVFYPEDTWIGTCDRLANHDGEDKLYVRHHPKARTLLEWFDIRSCILQAHRNFTKQHTNILKATLFLTIANVTGGWELDDAGLAFHRIGKFVADQATWECSEKVCEGNHTSCCKQWRMIGLPPQVVASYAPEPSITVDLHDNQTGILTFDIQTELTNHIYEEEDLYFGYILKKVCEKGRGTAAFFASETGEILRPRIEVTFKTYCDPTPTVVTEPPCPDKENDWDWDEASEL